MCVFWSAVWYQGNYVELQVAPSMAWRPCLFEQEVVSQLLATQFGVYMKAVETTDCLAELRRLVEAGPPRWVSDPHGLPLPEGQTHVAALWFSSDSSIRSAELSGAPKAGGEEWRAICARHAERLRQAESPQDLEGEAAAAVVQQTEEHALPGGVEDVVEEQEQEQAVEGTVVVDTAVVEIDAEVEVEETAGAAAAEMAEEEKEKEQQQQQAEEEPERLGGAMAEELGAAALEDLGAAPEEVSEEAERAAAEAGLVAEYSVEGGSRPDFGWQAPGQGLVESFVSSMDASSDSIAPPRRKKPRAPLGELVGKNQKNQKNQKQGKAGNPYGPSKPKGAAAAGGKARTGRSWFKARSTAE